MCRNVLEAQHDCEDTGKTIAFRFLSGAPMVCPECHEVIVPSSVAVYHYESPKDRFIRELFSLKGGDHESSIHV